MCGPDERTGSSFPDVDLEDLQRDGYAHRDVFATRPPAAGRCLTPPGLSTFVPPDGPVGRAAANDRAVRNARMTFDAARV